MNLYLKEGNVINGCNIYPEDVERGGLPYRTEEEIDTSLMQVPWGNKYISFQTENINGRIHVNNIVRYEVVKEG